MFARLLNTDKTETTVNVFEVESLTTTADGGSVLTMKSGREITTTHSNRKVRSLLAAATDVNGAPAEAE